MSFSEKPSLLLIMKLISTPISPHKKAAIISIVTNFFGTVPAESGQKFGFCLSDKPRKTENGGGREGSISKAAAARPTSNPCW